MLFLLLALGFLLWTDARWIQRVQHVSEVDTEDRVVDVTSPTGHAGAKRWYIVPEHNTHSFQWILETQQMFARGEWQVRRVDNENA
ncbi:MAG: hypothetical protein ABUL61_06525, partial [Oleiharenicola lentus]